jgi:hypothetical protein
MPHQRPPIRQKLRANTGTCTEEKAMKPGETRHQKDMGCSCRGEIDASNRDGGLTNILAGAVTAIEPSQPKAVGGKVYQN